MFNNTLWKFLDDSGTFAAKDPHKTRRLYFPLANEKGLLSSITPNLHGDIKTGLHSFLTPPASTEDLSESRYNRNFWIYIDGSTPWSATSGEADESLVEAGMLFHKVIRTNKRLELKSEVTSFIPATDDLVEIMFVEITNTADRAISITPTSGIPIYGRSADRLRDHRHVSSLLNRIELNNYGVIVKPTMKFDEHGHQINTTSYFVLGCEASGARPVGSFPTILEFAGESGNLDRPEAVLQNLPPVLKPKITREGKEAIGAIRFSSSRLMPGESKKYILILGLAEKKNPEDILKKFNSQKKITLALSSTKKFWQEKANFLNLTSGNKDFDRWLKWIALQPSLRKAFGCSFLPDFDYGRGGRGWRDLWQDSLALILRSPKDVRSSLINNFGGVREDGSNATIIGKKELEFISDRNKIERVWMDHGLWPFMTLDLYINQTGDKDILSKKSPHFESKRTSTILNHILLQHERPFTKIGKHGNFRLEDGDWNDGLDMAGQKGESVAFTAAYAGNLIKLSDLLEKINFKKDIINSLRAKASKLSDHIAKNEWIRTKSGDSFFNGYYDNLGKRVEGDHKNGVRMTLTGQVFPIMSGVASDEQIKEVYQSAKKYLWDPKLSGFRLNTDFKEIYTDLGRAFGFSYGDKENGAFFSHMNVMFAYALYKRGFVKEGFEVITSIYNMCMNTDLSKIYPGLPEYFNSDGRGLYNYLTGSATWFILTMLTEVFGIRGDMGDLSISPKLLKSQFPESKKISISTYFADRHIKVNYLNPYDLDYAEYEVNEVTINGETVKKIPIDRKLFLKLTSKSEVNSINATLNPIL